MATRQEKLSADEIERQRALDRSWETARRLLADDEFAAYLTASIARVQSSDAAPVSAEEFLAMTPVDD